MERESRAVILRNDASVADIDVALRKAEVAVARTLDLAPFQNTLGIALYRAGLFEGALEVLRLADELNREFLRPYHRGRDLAWIALALWELGEHEAARVTLAEAENIGAPDAETSAFLTRARARIGR